MTIQIPRAAFDALGFDLDTEIAAFAAARAAHADSEGEAAPRAHPLVEQIVIAGADYAIVEPPPPPQLPARPIKRHQGLLALLSAGITEQMIRDAIAEVPDLVPREEMRIRFEGPEWGRDSTFIAWGMQAFKLTAEQVDALFEAARAL